MAKLGRRTAMIIIDAIAILGVLICLFSIFQKSIFILYVGRFICGLMVGANSSLVPLYIKEVSPLSMTG